MKNHSEDNEVSTPSPKKTIWMRFSWLRNKFLLTAIGFMVWMFFIDRNDLPTQWKRVKELSTLQQSEKTMIKQINDTKTELSLLKTSPTTLEKYAREKYMMKRENEDLYIITRINQ